ncbi:MAG: multifunctional oxoglutarate decarboxylase/oxoglutarate dehydrogenase thiamine pyrophosphate-binding subunit/dihydrolipoyllysine-residue succinyltransferase subunit, partial [Bacteroidota bacterium]
MDPLGYNSGYVEDLYAQYLQNPESVSESWREFFADFDPGAMVVRGDGGEIVPAAPAEANGSAPPTASVSRPTPPTVAAEEAPSGDGAPAPSAAPSAPQARAPQPSAPSPSTPAPSPARSAPEVDVPEGGTTESIRGVAARIVDNMEASLTLPTATSVRDLPVKLMAENRRLLNRR